jgi:hypothetical protein
VKNIFLQNVLFSEVSNMQQIVAVGNNTNENLGFERIPTTLSE